MATASNIANLAAVIDKLALEDAPSKRAKLLALYDKAFLAKWIPEAKQASIDSRPFASTPVHISAFQLVTSVLTARKSAFHILLGRHLLSRLYTVAPEATGGYFSTKFVKQLLVSDGLDNLPIVADIIACLSPTERAARIGPLREVVANAEQNPQPWKQKAQVSLCTLVQMCPNLSTVPLRAQFLRWLGNVRQKGLYPLFVSCISSNFSRDDSEADACLQNILAFTLGVPLMIDTADDKQPSNTSKSISTKRNALKGLSSVLVSMPDHLLADMHTTVHKLATTLPTAAAMFTEALLRVAAWKLDEENICLFALGVVKGLISAGLTDIVLAQAPVLTTAVLDACHTRLSTTHVLLLRTLFLGMQSSPIMFHELLDGSVALLHALHEKLVQQHKVPKIVANSNPKRKAYVDESQVKALCQMFETLMYHYTGYPELYAPMESVMKLLRPSTLSEADMMNLLATFKLGSTSPELFAQRYNQSTRTAATGLVNLGNTCYLNSWLQALFVTDMACDTLLSTRLKVTIDAKTSRSNAESITTLRTVQSLFSFLAHSTRGSIAPHDVLRAMPSYFQDRAQHDVTEAMKVLLDHWASWQPRSHMSHQRLFCVEAKQCMQWETVLGSVFTGILRNAVTCATCGTRSTKYEEFDELSLAFDDAKESAQVEVLDNMLNRYLAPETISAENAYFCNICLSKQPAVKKLTVVHPPKHMVINLKRYKYDRVLQRRSKIMSPVPCPALLSLPIGSTNEDVIEEQSKVDQDGDTVMASDEITYIPATHAAYVLYGVIVHSGTSSQAGHYYCLARHSEPARTALEQALVNKKLSHEKSSLVTPSSSSLSLDLLADPSGAELEFAASCATSLAEQDVWHQYNDSLVTKSSFDFLRQLGIRYKNDVAYALLYRRVCDGEKYNSLTPLMELAQDVDADNARHAEEQKQPEQRQYTYAQIAQRRGYDGGRIVSAFTSPYQEMDDEDRGYIDPDML